MNRTLYSLLFYLALPLLLLRLWWRGRKAPDYRRRIAERMGCGLPPMRRGGIWLHTVSVGEAIAAAPLVRQLQQKWPDLPITLTCMTPTGSERIRAMFGDQVQHCYMPYDLPGMAARFLRHIRPQLAILMETELWPNHIHQCNRMGIAVMLANGRLSGRSARGYGRFPRLVAPMLAQLDALAVQSGVEAERFLELGASAERVSVTGSIKFDLQVDQQLHQHAAEIRTGWQPAQRPVWIAASTHAGEDEQILQAHARVLQQLPQALLILVPRHPERFDQVFQLCRDSGMHTLRRSHSLALEAGHQVLLGDSMGEMMLYYAMSDLAFVGGSLVAHGGHNVLEPIALGKPVLTGPHYFNFLDIVGQLQQANALREVDSSQALADSLLQLWCEPERSRAMQAAGQQVLQDNQGALQRLLAVIASLLQ